MKKRIGGWLAGILLVVLLMPVVSADLMISKSGQNPNPAKIGDSFILSVNVKNAGSNPVSGAECSISLTHWLKGDAKKIVSISPGATQKLDYSIAVDKDAAMGTYSIPVECKIGENSYKADIKADIESKYGTLNIKDVKTDPAVVEPGQQAKLYMTLDNKADYLVNEINVKLDFTGIDMAPYGESSEKKLKSIPARSSETVSFDIIALPKIEGGIYKIPFNLSYRDVTTKAYQVSSYISVEIGSKPEIDVIIDSSEIYGSKKSGEIVVKMVNRGLTDIKFLNLKLVDGDNYDVLSSDSVYIGNLDSDDYETADFMVNVPEKETVMTFALEFRDSSNKLFTQQRDVTFKKLSAAEAGKSGTSVWTIVIILAVVAYFLYRLIKKRVKK